MTVGESPTIARERRGSPREAVALAGSAFGIARSRSTTVSNVSPGGAQLDAHDLPMPGEELVMIVGSFETMATVVWRTSARCGILFEEEVPAETIARMKREAEWTAAAGWYR